MQKLLNPAIYTPWTWTTAMVWLANGLWCKLLNGVPRHRAIVGEILGTVYAAPLTYCIGAMEVLMAVWILSGVRRRLCVIMQITTVAIMNVLEFILVPHRLLFGQWNALFAALFIAALAAFEWSRQAPQPMASTLPAKP